MATHYSHAFEHDKLEQWATKGVQQLRSLIDPALVPVFCYTGFSGSAHGQAVVRAWIKNYHADYGEVYVRKEGEQTHGGATEWSFSSPTARKSKQIIVFVDDFVSSGKTRQYLLEKVRAMQYPKLELSTEYWQIEGLNGPDVEKRNDSMGTSVQTSVALTGCTD